MLQAQIAATARQIDTLVYKLYGLSADEIKIVEESGGKQGAESASSHASE